MAKGHHHSSQLDDLSCLWHLLCAPAGGGKSTARDSFSAGQGFVSWTVAPLLSLGEDQVIKINPNSATGDGAVVAFHLDHCA
jgi:hypothetical protein